MSEQNKLPQNNESLEQRFKNIFVSAGVGIAEISTSGDFLLVNNSFSKILGYSAEEIQTMNFTRLTHADDIKTSWNNIHQLLDGQIASYSMEKRYYHKSGATIWANLTVSLVRDAKGTPQYLVGVLIDITKQKTIEQQIKKLSQAIEQSPASVVITDTKGVIEYVNPIFSTVTGYSPEEVLGKNPRILKSGNFPLEFYRRMWQTILRGDIWRGEFINKRKNGENYWENASISPICNATGEITHFVAVKEDITLRKEMEAKLITARKVAEEANHAKSIFLANMSHEIRTPLNAILGFTQILSKDTALSADEQEKVRIINKSGEHLLSLINNILEISKIEAGRMTFNPSVFNLPALLKDLQNLFSLTVQEKGLALNVYIEPDVPDYIRTDEGKLKQILINLINNAIKFTDQGQIDLAVKFMQTPGQDTPLHFSVKDTGCGIAPQNLAKIFNYFEQGVIHNKGGTGIGLTLTQNFITFMGGKITVESLPGKGSEFNFFLPVGTSDRTKSTKAALKTGKTPVSAFFAETAGQSLIRNQQEITSMIDKLSNNHRKSLHQAAINGDMEYLEQFLEQIKIQYPLAAQQLRKIIDDFDFEKLNNLFT